VDVSATKKKPPNFIRVKFPADHTEEEMILRYDGVNYISLYRKWTEHQIVINRVFGRIIKEEWERFNSPETGYYTYSPLEIETFIEEDCKVEPMTLKEVAEFDLTTNGL
jgi:hypothetical protein